jgi:hypothetical protein
MTVDSGQSSFGNYIQYGNNAREANHPATDCNAMDAAQG